MCSKKNGHKAHNYEFRDEKRFSDGGGKRKGENRRSRNNERQELRRLTYYS